MLRLIRLLAIILHDLGVSVNLGELAVIFRYASLIAEGISPFTIEKNLTREV